MKEDAAYMNISEVPHLISIALEALFHRLTLEYAPLGITVGGIPLPVGICASAMLLAAARPSRGEKI
jgi:hypothetical protein